MIVILRENVLDRLLIQHADLILQVLALSCEKLESAGLCRYHFQLREKFSKFVATRAPAHALKLRSLQVNFHRVESAYRVAHKTSECLEWHFSG